MIFETLKDINFASNQYYYSDSLFLLTQREKLILDNLDSKNKLNDKIKKENLITSMEINKIIQYKRILDAQDNLKNIYLELESNYGELKFDDRVSEIITDIFSHYTNFVFVNNLFREFKKEHKINYKRLYNSYLEEIGEEWKLFKQFFYENQKYLHKNVNPIEVLLDKLELEESPKIYLKKHSYENNQIETNEIDILKEFDIYDINNYFSKEYPIIRLLLKEILEINKKSWYYDPEVLDKILNFFDLCELYFKLKHFDKLRIS